MFFSHNFQKQSASVIFSQTKHQCSSLSIFKNKPCARTSAKPLVNSEIKICFSSASSISTLPASILSYPVDPSPPQRRSASSIAYTHGVGLFLPKLRILNKYNCEKLFVPREVRKLTSLQELAIASSPAISSGVLPKR